MDTYDNSARFMIGAKVWPGISKLVEEIGEVAQIAGKIIGTNGQDLHWDGTNLRKRIQEELADLIAACTFVIETNNLDAKYIADRAAQKLDLFRLWHKTQAK